MVNLIPRLEFFAQSLFFSQRQCPHCRSDDCATLAKKYGSIRVKQCSRCRLCFTSPIYRTRLFPSLYGCVYHAEGTTTTPPAVEQLAFWKEEGFKNSDKDFTKVVEDLAKLCPGEGRRLLEIGCSWGYFLHQAARGGFKVTGIEINETLASYGREHLGVPIFKNFPEMKGGLFDLCRAQFRLGSIWGQMPFVDRGRTPFGFQRPIFCIQPAPIWICREGPVRGFGRFSGSAYPRSIQRRPHRVGGKEREVTKEVSSPPERREKEVLRDPGNRTVAMARLVETMARQPHPQPCCAGDVKTYPVVQAKMIRDRRVRQFRSRRALEVIGNFEGYIHPGHVRHLPADSFVPSDYPDVRRRGSRGAARHLDARYRRSVGLPCDPAGCVPGFHYK